MEHLTRTSKRPTYLIPLAVGIFSLLSCSGGGGDKDKPAQADTAAQSALAAIDCSSHMEYRHEVYDSTEVIAARDSFKVHFKVEVAGKNEAIRDPVLRIPWNSIETAQNTVAGPGKPVRGIYINYGLDGDRFHPVFEFMYPDPDNGDLLVFENAPFSFNGEDLVPEEDPRKYTDAYLENIRVDRTGAEFSALRATGEEPDPLATWYPYADKINDLLAQNDVQDTVLVVSCVSQLLCYKAIAQLESTVPEFRHLLALHVADGAVDHLSTGNFDPLKPYIDRAMDMGNVCPPRCPTGKP